ncbi:MAG: Ig-like domain-containing protein [Gemmatimonadales bacterium]
MPRSGAAALAVLLTSLTLDTCVFPTERDDAVHVSIEPLPVLIRGTDIFATARAWQILAAGDSQQLANVSFVWSSNDPLTATVDGDGHIVGIKSGTTMIRARAANFDKRSVAGAIALRVSAPLEIDSVRPQTVLYGQTVTVYGVGVDSLFQLSLGEGVLIPYFFTNTRNAAGYAQNTLWVPPPARTDSLFFIGNGVFGFSKDTVRVIRRDFYEPNEVSPDLIDLETSRPFPGTFLNFLLFLNPALAFEQLPRDVVQGADWYRLSQTTQRDLTIVVNSDVPGTFQTFLTDSLGFRLSDSTYFIGQDSWTFGPQSHACHGAAFDPKEAPAESTVVALKDFPAGALDAIAVYTQPGRYALSVAEGYAVTGKGIVRDSHEEDDYCNAADAKPEVLPFRDTLTIDNPHDVDWFRFSFPGGLQSLRVRTEALSSAAADSNDIDLYVLNVPSPGDPTVNPVATSARAGSSEDVQLVTLPAGDYYAVVVDFAGIPTRYSLCIGLGTSCNSSFPAPPAADLQASVTRRARLEATRPPRGPRMAPLGSGRPR